MYAIQTANYNGFEKLDVIVPRVKVELINKNVKPCFLYDRLDLQ